MILFVSTAAAMAGKVDFVAHYEKGSSWDGNTKVKDMIERVFGEFEKTLETGGDWDSTVDVYLTDDNKQGYANALVGSWEIIKLDKQQFKVSTAWKKIVEGGKDPNGNIKSSGKGADIIIHVNLSKSGIERNDGLVRHEMMHGLGAVSFIPWPTMSPSDKLTRPKEGDRIQVSLFDKNLFDVNKESLLGKYSSSKKGFELNKYETKKTQQQWKDDGDGGLFYRGIDEKGKPVDMLLGTGPLGGDLAGIRMHEINPVMYASYRNNDWSVINDNDKAFLRAMLYPLAGESSKKAVTGKSKRTRTPVVTKKKEKAKPKKILNVKRWWKDAKGKSFLGTLLSFTGTGESAVIVQDGKIKMQRGTKKYTIALEKLSPKSQELIKSFAELKQAESGEKDSEE